MKYKLIESKFVPSVINQVLLNRKIQNPEEYLNLTDDALYPYFSLANIHKAKMRILQAMETNENILLVVDCDCDGYCASAIFYKYITDVYGKRNLSYAVHTGKSHGLSRDIDIPKNTSLVILLDAGTNDADQCKELKEKGIDVVVIDHHLREKDNPYAIIVNPKLDDYKNPDLSGAAVVYKLLESFDDELWESKAQDYLDLVALSIIGDSMPLHSYENKRLVDKGLSQIKNKAFKAIIDKQSYSMNGDITINNIAFYIVPLINAIIRIGTQEEKDLLFRSFIETDEVFDYQQKRGEKELVKEDIYARVARLGTNCRAKQNREVDKALEEMKIKIDKYKWSDNKILFVDGTGIDGNFSGLAAMKLASMYNRPCIMFKDMPWKPGYFGGSGRNIDNSFIDSLKDFLDETKLFDLVAGHQGAFGVECKKENVRPLIEKTNELLKDVTFDHVYRVDFILEPDELEIAFIQEVDQLKKHYGQGIPECMIALKNVRVNSSKISLMGKESDSWKFTLNEDGVQVIKFKCAEDDKILQIKKDTWQEQEYVLELVGRVGINYFNNIYTPQFVVSDYNILSIKDL